MQNWRAHGTNRSEQDAFFRSDVPSWPTGDDAGWDMVDSVRGCRDCQGSGYQWNNCGRCRGRGNTNCPVQNCNNGWITCDNCDGDGDFECDYRKKRGSNRRSWVEKCDEGTLMSTRNNRHGTAVGDCPKCGGDWSEECRNCNGQGGWSCNNCGGNGQITCTQCEGEGGFRNQCNRCNGTGQESIRGRALAAAETRETLNNQWRWGGRARNTLTKKNKKKKRKKTKIRKRKRRRKKSI